MILPNMKLNKTWKMIKHFTRGGGALYSSTTTGSHVLTCKFIYLILIETQKYFDWCGSLMLFTTLLVVIFHILKLAPIVFKEKWVSEDEEEFKKRGFISKIIYFLKNILKLTFGLVLHPLILYYLAYGVFTFFGVYIHPFFFIFHTSEILMR